LEIRESRGGPLAEPDDPDAAAYAEGAALPNPGAKLAGPSFEGGQGGGVVGHHPIRKQHDTFQSRARRLI
jgi:hypothetical protein